MKILRRIAYGLLALLIMGWCVGWFIGKNLIERELGNTLTAGNLGDVTYAVDRARVGGFPFRYRIHLNDVQIRAASTDRPILGLDDRFTISASLPGTLWNGLTGGPIGARFDLTGTHDLGAGFALDLRSAWAATSIANLKAANGLDGVLNDLAFAGVNFNLKGLRLRQGQTTILTLDGLSLTMGLQNDSPGYDFDFRLTGLTPGTPLFENVPNRLDAIEARGRIQPDLRATYAQLLADLQENPIGAFLNHSDLITSLVSSEPGIYLDDSQLTWGDAQFQASLNMPFHIQIRGLSPTAAIELEGEIAGTNFNQRLQMLLREPTIQSSGLALPINGLLIGARSVGLDLETGAPATIQGTLLKTNGRSLALLPNGLNINGRSLPAL